MSGAGTCAIPRLWPRPPQEEPNEQPQRQSTAPKHDTTHRTTDGSACVRLLATALRRRQLALRALSAAPVRSIGPVGTVIRSRFALRLDARNHQDSPLWGGRGRGAGKAARSWSGRTKCGRQRACIGTRPISGWRSDYAGGPDTAQNRQQRRTSEHPSRTVLHTATDPRAAAAGRRVGSCAATLLEAASD